MSDFTRTDLRKKFNHVFVDILKLRVRGEKSLPGTEGRNPAEGSTVYFLSEWSSGDGRTRYRIETSAGRELSMNLFLQEMRHFLDGIILARELQATGKVAGPDRAEAVEAGGN